MKLTDGDRVGLEFPFRREGHDGSVSARAQIVSWRTERRSAPEIARMVGIAKWNRDSKTFTWTATTNEIITTVPLIRLGFKNLLDNNENSK